MGMTAVEKVLAKKSGRTSLRPGDVVEPDPDFIMIHDGVVMGAKREIDSLGITTLATPEKVVMVSAHDVIYGSPRAAEARSIQSTRREAVGCEALLRRGTRWTWPHFSDGMRHAAARHVLFR